MEGAELGLLSNRLLDIELCELLVGKVTLFWLFDNVEEVAHAVDLSQGNYSDKSNYATIKKLTTFHCYLKKLVEYRLNNPKY